MANQIKVGTYTGTGSVVSVIIGFTPDYIEAYNASELARWAGESSGVANLIRGATGSLLRIESKGFVTLTDAMNPSGEGFRGHSSVSQSGNTYHYIAIRNTDGA